MKKIIRLGTRGSPLALIQAEIVRDELLHTFPNAAQLYEIEIVPIRTSGDWRPENKEKSFLDMGATKGLFTKEIEEALLNNTIDMAVHSMKDVSVHCPDGLDFASILRREDPRDALLSSVAPCLADLPAGARVGTSSLRRKAQILAARPDIVVIPLRGNVDTRMRKLAADEADATILAVAGLSRLGLMDKIASIFDTTTMLPAAAQGCLGIQIRLDDAEMRAVAASINHHESAVCCKAERVVLELLDGSCRTPIGALAVVKEDGTFEIEALVAKKDGSAIVRRKQQGTIDQAEKIAHALGQDMRANIPADYLDES